MTGRQWTPAGNLRGSTITNGATTLGNDGHAFCGIFNGNGHTIRNLTMSTDSEQCYGLFGVLSSATVKNLVIDTKAHHADCQRRHGYRISLRVYRRTGIPIDNLQRHR